MEHYDLIVLGVGGVGSAALYHAACRGWRVLGIEQFGAAHDLGSSHGQSRIIRRAYFEHPDYVPMAEEAFRAWEEISDAAGVDLFQPTGLLQIGTPESAVIRGVRQSAQVHQLAVEELSEAAIMERWPVFRVEPGLVGLFEPGAGYLRVETCVAQLIRLAKEQGADLMVNSPVESWQRASDGTLEVHANGSSFRANRLIIAAGPWSSRLLSQLNLPLTVLRKQQQWFQLDRHEFQQANGMCCFLVDSPEGCFYGFPQMDGRGVKVAEHTGGNESTTLNRSIGRSTPTTCSGRRRFWSGNFRSAAIG